jgi:F-type H+-transporting ATPase subunit b
MFEILADPETWVAIAFAIFVAILVKMGVPGIIVRSLDARSARIKAEFDEAARLRQETEAILTEYQRKQKKAETEAQAIIQGARHAAERLDVEAKAKVEDFVARRTKLAATKIAQAEAQALADVRSATADAAIAAAERILVDSTRGAAAEVLVAKSIRGLKELAHS